MCGRTSGGGGHDFAGSVNVAGAGVRIQAVVTILRGRIELRGVGGGSKGVARWVGGDCDVGIVGSTSREGGGGDEAVWG